jgi:hypothetical protein
MILNKKMLTKREKGSLLRIKNAGRATALLQEFFAKGFTSLVALNAISCHYYPNLTITEVNNFWHFRNISDDLLSKMENILEQLKAEW